MQAAPPLDKRLDVVNAIFITSMHIVAIGAIVYMVNYWDWRTATLGLVYGAMCGLGITAGYHRLFSHPCYKANWFVRAFLLYFGAASVQNSALKWSADHRVHHSKTDTDDDPYNIYRGFWWAHIGWVYFQTQFRETDFSLVNDLKKDPLIRFQDKYYMPLALFAGALIPACIGALWGDFWGALLVVGALRLVIEWHSTFSVNSFTHMFGNRPYCSKGSARDSWIVAFITFGEGYHNYHHRFPIDFRNGVRWYHFDPTKWFVWTLSKIGFTWDLRRTTPERMAAAKQQVLNEAANASA